MKHIIRNIYWDFEKEEAWLNAMSAKGLAMTDYSWCRYVFADAPCGEYLYRIQLLEHPPAHPESAAYLRFLEESGIEHVASWQRWVYLRKKAAGGPFELFSDLDSKISHYRKVFLLWNTLMWVELIIGFSNAAIGLINVLGGVSVGYFNLGCSFSLMALSLVFFILGRPLCRKLKKLQSDRMVRE